MHTPTPEQANIIGAAKSTRYNLLVNALAGAAKTTTLEMICRQITDIPILSLAFNKRIADEMAKRLPAHVDARTMNSLGHSVWSKVIGKRVSIDIKKMHTILGAAIKALLRAEQADAWETMADTLGWLRAAKRDGYVPQHWRDMTRYNAGTMAQWLEPYPEEPSPLQCDLIEAAMGVSIVAAYEGGCDYDDQIYMPVCFGASWPKYPLVLIDEFQDLNALQHEMLAALVGQRLIGVGDPWQSIYGFRGAKQNGMAAARERWNMIEFPLSTTFRVPRRGVLRARERVPHMQWFDGAPEGRIEVLAEWDETDVPEGSAIICRNNAPLFSVGLRLLARRRKVKFVGLDIGAGLLKVMKSLGPLDMQHRAMMTAIANWQSNALTKAKREETVYERVECLMVLCEPQHEEWTLRHAISRAEALFRQEGEIQLLSGHKAKGLEWETVFHLDPWRVPSKWAREGTEEWEQELNVRYVIETRFKQNLFLVTCEGWT